MKKPSIKRRHRQQTLRWLLKNKNNKIRKVVCKGFCVQRMLRPLDRHIQWMREIIPGK